MDKEYIEIKNKYLAEALAFFNFKYYKFNNVQTGKTIYSFKNTEELKRMKDKLMKMKRNLIQGTFLITLYNNNFYYIIQLEKYPQF